MKAEGVKYSHVKDRKTIQQATGRKKMWKRPQINGTEWRHNWSCVTLFERLQFMSGNLSVKDQQYQYQPPLSGAALLSPLCLCAEGIVRPRLNPPLCSASVCSGSVQSRWRVEGGKGGWGVEGRLRKRPVDLDHSQGQSGVLLWLKLRTAHCDWLLRL